MLSISHFRITRVHHDYLTHIGIGIGKPDILLSLRSNRDTGDSGICLACLHRGDDGIKLHIEYLHIHTQHIADGIRHIHIDAHYLTILIILERFEGGIGGETKALLQTQLLQGFRSHLLHIRRVRGIRR